MVHVGIVIPVLYNFRGAVTLLESIKTELSWQPFIVPNWEDNIGVAAGWNKGIELASNAGCSHILISNDDVIMSKYCLDTIVEGFSEGVSMVTAHNLRETETQDTIKNITSSYQGIGSGPDFSCFMIKPELVEQVGTFDENFYPAYFEDNDYHRRMELLGYSAVCSIGAKMFHAGSITQNFYGSENSVCKPEMFQKNHDYFVKKWGCTTGMSHNEGYQTPYSELKMSPKEWYKLPGYGRAS